MAKEPKQEPEHTETLPKTRLRIPVPKRKDVMDAIHKVSKPDRDEPDGGERCKSS